MFAKGPSINDLSSEGEGGGQESPIFLSKKSTNGEGGGHKIQKMGRRRLWMAPKGTSVIDVRSFLVIFDHVRRFLHHNVRC